MNDSLENIQLIPVTDVKSIRNLYKELKKIIPMFTYQAMSEGLKYNKTYLPKVLNGHEPLTPEILKRINDTYVGGRQNVPRGRHLNLNHKLMSNPTEKDYRLLYEQLLERHAEKMEEYAECLKSNSSDLEKAIKVNQALIYHLFSELKISAPPPEDMGKPASENA